MTSLNTSDHGDDGEGNGDEEMEEEEEEDEDGLDRSNGEVLHDLGNVGDDQGDDDDDDEPRLEELL